jgi:AraC family transcriptional regulator
MLAFFGVKKEISANIARMIRATLLLTTPDLCVHRFDHPGGSEHHDPEQEAAVGYAISFVERGGFSIRSRYDSGELHPGDVLVTRPGDLYSCRHGDLFPDDICLSVSWRKAMIEADDEYGQLTRSNRRMVVPATNRLRYLGWRLTRCLAAPDTSLAAEGLALALWQAVVMPALRPAYRDRQLFWYADRVEAARELMERSFAEPLSLGALARAVGMSTFHFCRIFAELEGTPPHGYLLDVRLRSAAALLRNGSPVTVACFCSGFQNLSHFIRMFQRRFGVTPSRYVAD